MYYTVKNNKLNEYADTINKYWSYPKEAKYIDYSASFYNANKEQFILENNELINISDTKEYLEIKKKVMGQELIKKLKRDIEEIDKKRIRAICEPSIKEIITGESWIEYYNKEIIVLREKLENLEPPLTQEEILGTEIIENGGDTNDSK